MTYNITREVLEDLAFQSGGDAYFGYSGRGMYGKQCVGITLPSITDLINLGCAVKEMYENGEMDARVYEEITSGASTDNMGHSLIVYWSNINCGDAPDEDEEEE